MNVSSWLKTNFIKYKRVLYLAKKPRLEEFSVIARITGIGILLVGFIGFAVFMVFNLVKQGGIL